MKYCELLFLPTMKLNCDSFVQVRIFTALTGIGTPALHGNHGTGQFGDTCRKYPCMHLTVRSSIVTMRNPSYTKLLDVDIYVGLKPGKYGKIRASNRLGRAWYGLIEQNPIEASSTCIRLTPLDSPRRSCIAWTTDLLVFCSRHSHWCQVTARSLLGQAIC